MDEFFGTVDDGLHVVDGMTFIGSEEGVAVHSEEEVPAELVSHNNRTYTSRFERYLAAKVAAVIFYLAASIIASTILNSNLIFIKDRRSLQ